MSPAESKPNSPYTGPRTAAGKAISSMNAMRHGLTGRVVVLPSEDMNAYRAFCQDLMADLAPETALERQYAQTFCDTQWRLNRARSYEDSMLAVGHFEHADSLEGVDSNALSALTAARFFQANSKAFVNLSLYEQRLARQQKEALRQLQELQAQRKAAEPAIEKASPSAIKTEAGHAGNTSDSPTREFVFSTPEIERETHSQTCHARAESPLDQAA
jgi:enoyl-CoA hydratase/carnithine racemase